MSRRDLDVTLKNGRVVKQSLAYWLVQAADNPDNLRVNIVEQRENTYLLKLQDEKGRATGGILLADPEGSVHVSAAIDPQNKPMTKHRSFGEMYAARNLALERDEQQKRYVKLRDHFIYGVIPIVVLALFSLLIEWLL